MSGKAPSPFMSSALNISWQGFPTPDGGGVANLQKINEHVSIYIYTHTQIDIYIYIYIETESIALQARVLKLSGFTL